MKLLAADCGGTRIKLGLIDDRAVVATAVIDARAGDPLGDRPEEIAGRFDALCVLQGWGALLINLIHGYDPERIVIGGGIIKQAEVILPALQAIVNRQATQPGGTVEIMPACLGDFAALLGAPWLWEHLQMKSPPSHQVFEVCLKP